MSYQKLRNPNKNDVSDKTMSDKKWRKFCPRKLFYWTKV